MCIIMWLCLFLKNVKYKKNNMYKMRGSFFFHYNRLNRLDLDLGLRQI